VRGVGGRGMGEHQTEVAQTMYTHMNKCIKQLKKRIGKKRIRVGW
jgi:hypothetical protein